MQSVVSSLDGGDDIPVLHDVTIGLMQSVLRRYVNYICHTYTCSAPAMC